VFDGDNSSCSDECGVPNGDSSSCADLCGVPNGDNSSCADCAGTPNGDAVEDMCDVCDSDSSNDCVQDCSGDWGGSKVNDECGVCDGDNSLCNQPVAYNSNIIVEEDGQVTFTLDVSDPNDDALMVNILSGPYHGSYSGSSIELTYTPDGDYFGNDDFMFNVTDGEWTSNSAEVSIEIIGVNDAPTADFFIVEVSDESSNINFDNYINDADGDILSLSTIPPASTEVLNTIFGGTLTPTGSGLEYTFEAAASHSGPADFVLYRALDGATSSGLALATYLH
jgi:hypothetical protein